MLLLVGLGNPGPSYKHHRHNAGFMVLDRVHRRALGSEWREKYVGLASKGILAGKPVTMLLPSTFMNHSGRSVQRAVAELRLEPARILVVHDELELPFGQLRVKQGGGHGGHNGLRDITAQLGGEYARVRFGIGRPTVGAVDSYVLSPFAPAEVVELDGLLERAADAVERFVAEGVEAAMTAFNPPEKKRK